MKIRIQAILYVCLCILPAGCASQKDILILDERLAILERQNSQLQSQLTKELERFGKTNQNTEMGLRDRYATLTADLEQLRQELLLNTGRMEEVTHQTKLQVDDARQRQEKMDELSLSVAKLDQRMTEIERYLNLEKTGAKPSAAPVSTGSAAPAGEVGGRRSGDEQLYEDSKKAFDDGQMEKARQGFQQYLKTYPKSANADNAQFWIGETYYQEKWYEKAILEYQAVIEKYPKGNKVAAAMLKQGMAFLQLGDKSNSRLIFKELVKKYPKSNEAAIAKKKLNEL